MRASTMAGLNEAALTGIEACSVGRYTAKHAMPPRPHKTSVTACIKAAPEVLGRPGCDGITRCHRSVLGAARGTRGNASGPHPACGCSEAVSYFWL